MRDPSEEEYEVEAIVGKKKIGSNVEYLVKWLNFPISDCTWEPLRNLQNCKKLVNEYERKIERKSNEPKPEESFLCKAHSVRLNEGRLKYDQPKRILLMKGKKVLVEWENRYDNSKPVDSWVELNDLLDRGISVLKDFFKEKK